MPRTLLALLVLSLATLASPAATDTERTEAIRASIAELAGPLRVSAQPFEASFEYGLRATRSLDDLQRSLEPLADRPDHPDRQDLEAQAALAARPYEVSVIFTYANTRSWAIDEVLGDRVLRLGELDGVRWIWSDHGANDGQMTITRAGVPFPPGYNVGLAFRSQMQNVRRLTNAGVPQGDHRVVAVDPSVPVWTAMLDHAATGDRMRLEGEWIGTDPVATTFDRFTLSPEGVATPAESVMLTLENQKNTDVTHAAAHWHASASVLRTDGVIEWVGLSAVTPVSRDALASRAHHPAELVDSEPSLVVRDYRDAAAAARDTPDGMTMLVFDPGQPAHRVDRPEANNGTDAASSETARDQSALANIPPTQPDDKPRGLAIGIVAALITGLLALAFIFVRRNAP